MLRAGGGATPIEALQQCSARPRPPDDGATLLPYRGRQHAAATDTVSKRQACGVNLLNAHERTQHGAETLFQA